MGDLKWRGCGEGSYVSHDGRFLVVVVVTPGKKGPRKRWALYGRVLEEHPVREHPPAPWSWGDDPVTVAGSKGECQRFAENISYEPPARVAQEAPQAPQAQERVPGLGQCPGCTVRFTPEEGHKYGDYCGKNCAENALEFLLEMVGNGVRLDNIEGRPLRVGPAAPNQPAFIPARRRP